MNKVIVTRPFCGLVAMQVCAEESATDEEILEVCNRENPAGTSNGWSSVVRKEEEGSMFATKAACPVKCEQEPGRLHFMVLC